MLQSLGASPQDLAEPPEQNVGVEHFIAIGKRRLFHFLIPALLALLAGSLLIAIQRPIYRSEGKILVESQDIPKDLVKPTITDSANQRIQIIQQRSMTRDNLLRIVRKYGLFPQEQRWMSESQLVDLMKARTTLQLVDLDPLQQQTETPNAIAFTLSFDYENPALSTRVANEFLTGILNDDVVNRNNRAAETTRFMDQEVKRLQGEVGAINGKITEVELKPQDPVKQIPEQYKIQREELNRLKLELVQKSAIYSSAYPEVKSLNKRIAALEKAVAAAPKAPPQSVRSDNGLTMLRQQLTAAMVQLDDANRKLTDARLGESLESNQQSERLQVIEQPVVPQVPIKPNRPKLFALVFAMASMGGLAMVVLAETLDKSIHGSQDLAGIVDSRLVLAIPYIATASEGRRRKTRLMVLLGAIALVILVALGVALYLGVEVPAWGDRAWLDRLTHL